VAFGQTVEGLIVANTAPASSSARGRRHDGQRRRFDENPRHGGFLDSDPYPPSALLPG
jgi:hypothetical protein